MHRCPGRHFAEAEIALAVAMLLGSFRLTLQGGVDRGKAGAAEGRRGLQGKPAGARTSCQGSSFTPGDADSILPVPELRRQVGVRWPRQLCWVQVEGRLGQPTY